MSPLEFAIKPFKQYADFNGRARRSEYWWYTLLNIIVRVLIIAVAGIEGETLYSSIWLLATLVPSIAVGVRRMHDVGKSGWFILIPIYNLILACTDGDNGSNEYGPDPKGDALFDDIDNIGKPVSL